MARACAKVQHCLGRGGIFEANNAFFAKKEGIRFKQKEKYATFSFPYYTVHYCSIVDFKFRYCTCECVYIVNVHMYGMCVCVGLYVPTYVLVVLHISCWDRITRSYP